MRCSACGEESSVSSASFCPHCGAALQSAEGDATRELSLDAPSEDAAAPDSPAPGRDEDPATEKIPAGGPLGPQAEAAGEVARDFSRSLRRAAIAGGWKDASIAAAFAFLTACACGAVLMLAAKLHLPSLGEGATLVSMISGVVMAGLGVVGAQLHIGDVTVSALPMGALAIVLWAIAWSVARYVREAGVDGPRSGAFQGIKVAVPLAVICWLAALIFRVRTDPDPVFIGAVSAAFAGALWGVIGGAIGGLVAHATPGTRMREALKEMERASRPVYEGLVAGGAMLAIMGVGVVVATLLWVIVGLLGAGGPAGKEVLGAGIYLLAFLPNVIAAVATLSLGGAVEIGAQVTAGGELVGRVQDVSLWSWKDGSDAPWPLFLLLAIPLASTVLGGFAIRRRTRHRRQMWLILGLAAGVFAGVLAEAAALADARLGAGLVHDRGFGVVAPRAWTVLLLALVWGWAGGAIGWKVAEAQPERGRG